LLQLPVRGVSYDLFPVQPLTTRLFGAIAALDTTAPILNSESNRFEIKDVIHAVHLQLLQAQKEREEAGRAAVFLVNLSI
jgi:hypothetical protein